MRISFKIYPLKPENIFTPDFREKMKEAGSRGCVVYLDRKSDGSVGEFSKVEMHFDNPERRDEVLDTYLPYLNELCKERSLERKIWCFPFRDFEDSKQQIEDGLMLYAMNVPPEVTHSQLKALVPEAESITLPVDESGKTLGHALLAVPSLEIAAEIYQKKYRLNDVQLSFYRPATKRRYVKNMRKQRIAERVQAERKEKEKAAEARREASGEKATPIEKKVFTNKGFPGAKAQRRAEWIATHGGPGNLKPKWTVRQKFDDRRNYYESRRDYDMDRMRTQMELQVMMMRQQLQQDMKAQFQEAMHSKSGGDDQSFNSNKRKRNPDSESYSDFSTQQSSMMGSGMNMNRNRQWGDTPDSSGGGYNRPTNSNQGYGGNYSGNYGANY